MRKKPRKTVKEILIEALKKQGYSGLYNRDADDCGCSLDDFSPCGENCMECHPGYEKDGLIYAKKPKRFFGLF